MAYSTIFVFFVCLISLCFFLFFPKFNSVFKNLNSTHPKKHNNSGILLPEDKQTKQPLFRILLPKQKKEQMKNEHKKTKKKQRKRNHKTFFYITATAPIYFNFLYHYIFLRTLNTFHFMLCQLFFVFCLLNFFVFEPRPGIRPDQLVKLFIRAHGAF